MLTISDLHFAIEGRPLFERSNVTIPTGHKVGFVGRNGTGKSTLFRIIRGELEADLGTVSVPRGARIGGVAQEAPATQISLLDTVLAADTELMALRAEAETVTDPTRIGDIHTRLADIEAHSAEARAAIILSGLGFSHADQARPTADFSGGWRMRVALAAVLFSRPDLLLLDEPTNYLDLEGTIWLESYIARYPYTTLIISHDRGLLNRAVGHILHLNERRLTLFTGRYDQFERARHEQAMLAAAQAKKQAAERDHLQSFVDRFRYKASKAKQAQSRLKRLEKMQEISLVQDSHVAGFSFPDTEALSPPIVKIEDVVVGYDGKPILSGLNLRIDQDDRIALLGANGQGKSTLSKLIAGRLSAMEGRVVTPAKLRIGYFAQHQVDELTAGQTPIDHIRALRPQFTPQKIRAILGGGGIGADIAENPVERLSGGQKARLAMLIATIDAPHLVILDEPTNHLDIDSRAALVDALTAFSGAVILVSHDPHLVDCVADQLWLVDDGRVKPFDDDMEGYRRFLLSRRAVAHGERKSEPQPKRPSGAERRAALAPLREDVRKCEDRITKLEEMQGIIDARLADSGLYSGADAADRIATLQKKRAEVVAGLERAETLWLAAQEKLDAAMGA